VPTRLARQAVTAAAVRGDGAALLAATAYLPAREAFRYDRRRAAAFSSALAGERTIALGELGLGGGVRSVRLGLDIAIIELLTRGAAPAVEAVRLALRDGVHGEPDVPVVLAACVRRDPDVARSALAVALGGGTPLERTRAAAAVIGATRPGPVQAAVPALVAVSLAVAALAFMRLPGVTDSQEAATPRLQQPRPSVVVVAPPKEAGGGASARAQAPQAATPEAVSIAVRFTPGGSGSGSADGTGSLNGREGSRPATPRPKPTPAAPGPSAPEPAPPAEAPTVSPPTAATSADSTAARPASTPPAAAPPAEPPRQPTVAKPSKAERRAEKADRKAEKAEAKAARKAEKAAPASAAAAQPAPLTPSATPQPEAEAAVALSASATESDDERRSKPDKPDKPEKPDKPDKDE
jgi:hypothetical protein